MGDLEYAKHVKCCLCQELVLLSGWCENCQRWPINITPRRWCERAHPVDPEGLCFTCNAIVLTRLEVGNAEWRDTGKVENLLSREENHQWLKALMAGLKDFGSPRRVRQAPLTPEQKAVLAAEHAHIRATVPALVGGEAQATQDGGGA